VSPVHRVVAEDLSPVSGRGRRRAVLAVVSLVAAAGVAAAGLGVRSWTNRLNAPPTCESFAYTAAAGGTRRGLVIKVPGNTAAAHNDVERFVRAALTGTDPTQPLTVDLRFVAGDDNYAASGCFSAPLTIQANAFDLEGLKANDSESNREVVAEQRRRSVDTVAAAAADAVAAISPPTEPAAGLLTVLQVAADVAETSEDVFVMTSTDTSADDCLHATRASDPDPAGGTVADGNVQNCVTANALRLIAGNLHIEAPRTLRLTGAQQAAADAVFEAVCAHATVRENCSA
jgi:hypothetical protein